MSTATACEVHDEAGECTEACVTLVNQMSGDGYTEPMVYGDYLGGESSVDWSGCHEPAPRVETSPYWTRAPRRGVGAGVPVRGRPRRRHRLPGDAAMIYRLVLVAPAIRMAMRIVGVAVAVAVLVAGPDEWQTVDVKREPYPANRTP